MVGSALLLFLLKKSNGWRNLGKGAINPILIIVMVSAPPLLTSLIVLHAGRFFSKREKKIV